MDDKLDTSKGYFVQSIGEIRSCFKACLGMRSCGCHDIKNV